MILLINILISYAGTYFRANYSSRVGIVQVLQMSFSMSAIFTTYINEVTSTQSIDLFM